MRRITSLAIAVLFAGTFALPTGAEATTYYYPTSYPMTASQSSSAALQLQQLYAQLLELQRQLAALTQSCSYLGTCGGSYGSGLTTVSSVDVEFLEDDDYAEVSIRYYDGDRDEFLLDAETESEVIDFLVSETDNARTHLLAVTDFSDDGNRHNDDEDVDDIDVEVRSGDAHVDVRYEDGSRDSFTIRDETNHRDIIEEVADELDMDEDDVEDIIDFDDNDNDNNDDVDSIDVTIFEDDNEATARVRFEDGDTTTYRIDTDDEDDIIEELADLLDMDENDVEDIIDFEYNHQDEDVDSIDVTIFEDDDEAEALVRFEDGSRTTYFFDTEDEDDIIEELADLLDMDEDDVEDIVDFEYED